MKKLLIAMSLSTMITGCATQTFNVNSNPETVPSKEDMQMFFVEGIGQKKVIDSAKVCGGADKVGKVETEVNLINGLISSLSFGVVAPRTARVYCIK
jgi:uncharacterized lipoprotein YajG